MDTVNRSLLGFVDIYNGINAAQQNLATHKIDSIICRDHSTSNAGVLNDLS